MFWGCKNLILLKFNQFFPNQITCAFCPNLIKFAQICLISPNTNNFTHQNFLLGMQMQTHFALYLVYMFSIICLFADISRQETCSRFT